MFTNSHCSVCDVNQKRQKEQGVIRRAPSQARSLAKIELMFEAALRILETEELTALTTNRVAAVAGVSIGTLYQYFPDKEALLLALVRREVEATFAQLTSIHANTEALKNTASRTLPTDATLLERQVRRAVRVMVNALGGRLRARKRLMLALARSGQAHLLDEEILRHGLAFMQGGQTAERGSSAGGSFTAGLPKLDFVQAFVMTRAVSGTLRAALLHDEHLLHDSRFEDALCALITGYLREQGARGREPGKSDDVQRVGQND
jgi:AcrR family transcriptional regulator